MMNAAAADLIQRAYKVWDKRFDYDRTWSYKVCLQATAREEGTYLDSDVELAIIAVDELGLIEAVLKAQEINQLDEVTELFNALVKDLQDPDTPVDFDEAFQIAERFSRYDHGRFRGMVEIYMSYGPAPVMPVEEWMKTQEMVSKILVQYDADKEQRRSMGFDDDDPVVG